MNRKLNNHPKVLFVGSFREAGKDGSVGGQMFACRSLVKSNLNKHIDWILLDTTGESVPPPPLIKRGWNAIKRILNLIQKLIFAKEVRTILIFCSNGWSFIEKGVMVFLGKMFGRKVIIAPRSGRILKDIENIRFRQFASRVFRKADVVLCQSNRWKDVFTSIINTNDLNELNIENHFIVRQNWVDVESYIQNRPVYRTREDKVVFLYLGWLELYKGIADLLEAINMIKDQLPNNIRFIIAGDGSQMDPMKRLSRDYGIDQFVEFMGWAGHTKKMELLRTVDAFILPSHFEGFPNSLMEAMASGLPSIATRVGAVEDFIQNDVNGILIDSRHPKQIAHAIFRILKDTDLRTKLGNNARQYVIENNSIDSAVKTFQKILE